MIYKLILFVKQSFNIKLESSKKKYLTMLVGFCVFILMLFDELLKTATTKIKVHFSTYTRIGFKRG